LPAAKRTRIYGHVFFNLAKDYQITFKWVKGHADNPFNNRCDILATTAADGQNLLVDEEYEREMANL
jgi:ribonuclease HI